jgi:phospholipid transport system substrate-binding protein
MKAKKFLTLGVTLIITFLSTVNSNSIEPDIFVQSTVNRASQALGDNFSKEEKIKKLKTIAKETVDIKGIGFYTLGQYRKSLSDDQKIQYANLFEQYFLKSFSSRLAEYSNPEIQVTSKEKLNEKYTMVSSVLVATKKKTRG